jgi:excisionase family DNA binding protein
MNKLLTVPEVAEQLAVKPCTIRKWINQRRLAVVRVGQRAIRVQQKDVDQIIREGFSPAIR